MTMPGGGGRPMGLTTITASRDPTQRSIWSTGRSRSGGSRPRPAASRSSTRTTSPAASAGSSTTRGYYLLGFDTSLALGVPPGYPPSICRRRRGLRIRARRGRFGPDKPGDGPAAARQSAGRRRTVTVFDRRDRRAADGAGFGHDPEAGSYVRSGSSTSIRPGSSFVGHRGGRKGAVTAADLALDDTGQASWRSP